jgi:hypothetical protein
MMAGAESWDQHNVGDSHCIFCPFVPTCVMLNSKIRLRSGSQAKRTGCKMLSLEGRPRDIGSKSLFPISLMDHRGCSQSSGQWYRDLPGKSGTLVPGWSCCPGLCWAPTQAGG